MSHALTLDMSALTAVPTNATATPNISPSRNACMVRVPGSRYRNDPYTASVLPSLGHTAPALPMASAHTNKLAPLPPALVMAQNAAQAMPALHSRLAMRFKKDVAMAAAFASPCTPDEPRNAMYESFSLTSNDGGEAAQELPADFEPFAFVKLKHETLIFNISFAVGSGDYVIVEGDRGVNVGIVSHTTSAVPPHPVSCSVLRFASTEEILQLEAQRQREEAARHFAQGVADTLQLNIRIVDTEFQSDGNKLTVYFSSRRVIDFRRLQRQLFRQYRCRIWLVNWADVRHSAAPTQRSSRRGSVAPVSDI